MRVAKLSCREVMVGVHGHTGSAFGGDRPMPFSFTPCGGYKSPLGRARYVKFDRIHAPQRKVFHGTHSHTGDSSTLIVRRFAGINCSSCSRISSGASSAYCHAFCGVT